jgi:hypothetical protein
MLSPARKFRLVIQQLGYRAPHFRVVAYGEGMKAHADFSSLPDLLSALDAALPDVRLNARAAGSVVFAGDLELDDLQMRTLKLVSPTAPPH